MMEDFNHGQEGFPHHGRAAYRRWLLAPLFDALAQMETQMALDTSRLLASVTAADTKIDALIALSNQQTATLKDLSAQLAAAIAANDPAAIAQVQADMDTAATELDAESAKVQTAIDANTPPANTP